MNKINEVSIKSSIIIAGFVLITAILSVIIILFVVQIFLNQQQTIAKNLLEKTNDIEKLNKLMIGREVKMIDFKKELTKKQ